MAFHENTKASCEWAQLDLNQRPPACEAGVLPLNYEPIADILIIVPDKSQYHPVNSDPAL